MLKRLARPAITKGHSVGRLVALCILIAANAGFSTKLYAQDVDARYEFRIEAGSLGEALDDFVEQTGLMVLFPVALADVEGMNPVIGTYNVSEALDQLFEGTSLSGGLTENGGIFISSSSNNREARVTSDKKKSLLASVAALVFGAGGAFAQEAEGAGEQAQKDSRETGDSIVVTGTRIDRPGYESPTPLLSMSKDDLQVVSRANLGAALADLPQFKASSSPITSSTNTDAGRFPVNIRGLGNNRSLILVDGHRLVTDDLNIIPSVMVDRIDIVTGGASAAWGSEAVAGVVNIIIDSDYEGVFLGASGGVSSRGDGKQIKIEGKIGTSFADGRGHFVIGGEYVDNDGVAPRTSRENTGRWSTLGNTKLTTDIGYSRRLVGGLIRSGVLSGMAFNPDGTLRTPDFGTVVGSEMIGGEGPSNDDFSQLITPQRRYAAMAKASYELTDTLKLSGNVRFSRYYNVYPWFGSHSDDVTISADNAFLNDDIKMALADAGETSFTLSRFNGDLSFADMDVDRRTVQASVALDGSFDDGRWRYSAYLSHGEYRNKLRTPGFLITQNFADAVDSVIHPVSGDPVCRVALTDPDTDCVPLNLFGEGAPSEAAIGYVTGTPRSDGLDKLNTYGVSLRGEPFDLPAGPVSIALGIEGRDVSTTAEIGELDAAEAFNTFFFTSFSGDYSVKEAFAEVVAPVIKDTPVFRKLELNGAVRASDYSTSGVIWSWKAGLTNEFVPGLIGRVSRSRDIRAPDLSELYTTPTLAYSGIVDPLNPSLGTSSTIVYGGGNPRLEPERADTWTAGFTAAPLPGLTASIDYFNITIKDVISSLGGQNIVDRCFAGNTSLCQYIVRDSDGLIESISSSRVNLSEFKTDGIDAEVAYAIPVNNAADGQLIFRVIGTWVNSFSTDDGITEIERVGTQGIGFSDGAPRVRANASIGYASDSFSGLVRARFISSGYWDRARTTLTNNDIPAYVYIDLRLSQKLSVGNGKDIEVYGNVSNLFDKAPPLYSVFTPYYDVIGRYMSLGVRMEF